MHVPEPMLTPLDDYPVHQTSRPLAMPASGDPNHYDRFFFNGSNGDGSLFFALALGVYPNRDVIDASFSVVRRDEQVNVHGSGQCPLDRMHPEIGPIRVEILQPMVSQRIVVEAPEHGLRADLAFTARTAPLEEPHFFAQRGTRMVWDYTRLTQFGSWAGWLSVDDERFEVAPAEFVGCRDRSWGVRSVGAPLLGPAREPQFYWLWAPVSFDDVCTHMDVCEDATGGRWHETGFVVPVGPGGAPSPAASMDYRIEWRPGTRRAAWAEIDLAVDGGADLVTVRLEPIVEFQMTGLGYINAEWNHGAWKGELAVGGSRWALPVEDPLAFHHLHIQALCRATMGDKVGVGVLEQLVFGPHSPSGFTQLNDGAP